MTDKTKFICNRCNYKFTRITTPELCPMCGQRGVQEDLSQGAQDILDEITEKTR